MDMAGDMWFDGFAGPWIADVAVAFVVAGVLGWKAAGSEPRASD
jgi:hypothetical protein